MVRTSIPDTSHGFQFRTPDLDEFREVVSERIRPCRYFARSARHEAALRHHRAGSLGFSIISVTPDVEVEVEPADDYLFQTPLAGSFCASSGGPERSYGEGDVHVVNPARPLRISPRNGSTLLVIRIAKSTLEEHARVLTDGAVDHAFVLPESLPIADGKGASLWRYLMFLHAEIMTPGNALHSGVASRSAEQMLTSLMLAVAERGERSPDSERPPLTTREIEIARLVAAGYNNLEIAKGLSISRNTVKEALKRIFRKVDVDSRAELVLRLSEARLL
jgi:DNA-binding CsgD family transcriptional regulator